MPFCFVDTKVMYRKLFLKIFRDSRSRVENWNSHISGRRLVDATMIIYLPMTIEWLLSFMG